MNVRTNTYVNSCVHPYNNYNKLSLNILLTINSSRAHYTYSRIMQEIYLHIVSLLLYSGVLRKCLIITHDMYVNLSC